jgi:hypothetical protein
MNHQIDTPARRILLVEIQFLLSQSLVGQMRIRPEDRKFFLVPAKTAIIRTSTMSTPDGHLIRMAFLTKYGYSPDLTHDEIVCEFQRRYDHAQARRLENAGSGRIMLIIEGMSEASAKEDAILERELRKRKIERLTRESGYGAMELDQLVEGYAARLEVLWIQQI